MKINIERTHPDTILNTNANPYIDCFKAFFVEQYNLIGLNRSTWHRIIYIFEQKLFRNTSTFVHRTKYIAKVKAHRTQVDCIYNAYPHGIEWLLWCRLCGVQCLYRKGIYDCLHFVWTGCLKLHIHKTHVDSA